MGVLDGLAEFVCEAKASALVGTERAILRRHAADVVSARLAGAACSEGQAVSAFYPPGKGAESIAGLATLVRLTETDDIHTSTGTTPSSVAVPVALGLAAAEPCSAERLESAIFVAVETIVRLAKAAGGASILYQGVWPTRAGATLGAAAAACRVWGLSREATANALSLALLLTSGRTGRFEGQPSGRWILFGSSVAAGIRAAEAARAGFRGDAALFDTGGLDRALGVAVASDVMVADLGRKNVFSELSLKPYCTSRQALSGAEAMRALRAKGLDPREIESFVIRVPKAYAGMISQKLDPAIRSSAYVSGAGVAAIAALEPDALFDLEREKVLADVTVIELARKGEVKADPELDPLYPDRWPARLDVTTRSGKLIQDMREPLGDPRRPMGDGEIEEKARKVLGHMGLAEAVKPWIARTSAPFETDAAAQALARFFVDGVN